MKGCGDYGANIEPCLDKELNGRELEEFRAHFEGCKACRAELKEEEELSRLLHLSRPLYRAPGALRDRVLQITAEPLPWSSYAPPRLRKRILKILARTLQSATRGVHHWPVFGSCNSSRCCRTSTGAENSAAGERQQLR